MSKSKIDWTQQVWNPEKLDAPLRRKKPTVYFVSRDLFHHSIFHCYIEAVFGVMGLCPQHRFIVLTKRPEKMLEFSEWYKRADFIAAYSLHAKYVHDKYDLIRDAAREAANNRTLLSDWPLPNVWLGVSVEDQQTADERIPLLLQTPAAYRFVSYEPAIGPVDFSLIKKRNDEINALTGKGWSSCANGCDGAGFYYSKSPNGIDWLIMGGETGKDARPMHPDWAARTQQACEAAKVPFFFKQWGEWVDELNPVYDTSPHSEQSDIFVKPTEGGSDYTGVYMYRVGKKAAGHLLDGKECRQFPPAIAAIMEGE